MSSKKSLTFHCFSLVVVRLGRRFLLVQERKHDQAWYLPAGRVDSPENFQQGAVRETREESGIDIILEGVLRVELSPPLGQGHYRQRVIFLARPADDTPPRNRENDDTLGAAWFTLEEARTLKLRGDEVLPIFEYVEAGGAIYPLTVLAHERDPWGQSTSWRA